MVDRRSPDSLERGSTSQLSWMQKLIESFTFWNNAINIWKFSYHRPIGPLLVARDQPQTWFEPKAAPESSVRPRGRNCLQIGVGQVAIGVPRQGLAFQAGVHLAAEVPELEPVELLKMFVYTFHWIHTSLKKLHSFYHSLKFEPYWSECMPPKTRWDFQPHLA